MHFPSLYPRALISNRLHNGCTGAHVTDEIMSRCAVSIFFLKLYTGTGSVIEHTNWYAFQFARQQTFETFTYVWTCMLGTVQYLSFDTITNDTFCTIARCVSIFFLFVIVIFIVLFVNRWWDEMSFYYICYFNRLLYLILYVKWNAGFQ